jgi:hypothetical protein
VSDQRGYYLMHRGWLDHPALDDGPFCRRACWADMIEMASWRPRQRSISGKTIGLQRGEFTASIRFLATRWKVDKGKVERFIVRLKTETMIETRTETGQLVIRICNYDKFQAAPNESETSSETAVETATRQQQDSSETKENKGNPLNEGKLSPSERAPAQPKRRKPSVSFPEDDAFKLRCQEACAQLRPELDFETVFRRFRNHAIANDRRCAVWVAAWNNWLDTEKPNHGTTHQDRPGEHRVGASITAATQLARKAN